jgi:hypothetical protein
MQAGITFWAKWLDVTLGHYSTQTRRWALAVREPDKSPEHVQKMLDEFKTYLASAAQFPGQAVLSFNQRFEELLREPRPDPAAESPLGLVLSDEFKRDLARLQASRPLQDLARKTQADIPDPDALVQALMNLGHVQNLVYDARLAAHGALEGALQFARKLSVQLEETEESPSDLLRRTMASLERIRASLGPENSPQGQQGAAPQSTPGSPAMPNSAQSLTPVSKARRASPGRSHPSKRAKRSK